MSMRNARVSATLIQSIRNALKAIQMNKILALRVQRCQFMAVLITDNSLTLTQGDKYNENN